MEKEKITIENLLKKISPRYTLVNLVSKRVQEMLTGSEKPVKGSEMINKVFKEIIDGKIKVKLKEELDESKQGKSKDVKEEVLEISPGRKS